TGVTPSLALDNRPIGRYFQYRAFLENNSALTGTIPMLRRVTVRSADIPEGFTASQGQCQSVLQENFPSTEAPDIYHQVLTCTLGTLPVGGSANVLAALQPTQWGPFTYTVALTPTGLLFNRANPDGAQSSYQTTLVRPVEALTITAVTITSPPVVEAGQPAVFTTTVSSNDTSPKVFYSWTVIAEQGVTAPTPAPTRTVSFNLVEPITVTPFASGVFTLTAVVSNSAGALTGTLPFTVAPAPMTVTSFHPPELVTGTLPTATFPFVITGTGFQENTKVEWNGDQLGGGELADNCPGPCTRITATISVSRTVLGVNTVVIRNGPGLDPATTVTLTHVVSTPVLSLALAGPDPLAADLVRPATTVVTATISRAQSQARTITLATTPAVQSFLALPATVNLPAGASAVTFTITGTLGGGPVTLVGQLPASIGAQTSNPVTVTVYNPQPQINTLTPTTATVGQAGLTLQIAGSNFVNGAAVFWDGVPLANPLVTGTTQLTADILANQLDISRTVNITVSNPAPNAGVSGSLPFRVISPTLQLNPASNSLNLGQTQPLTLVLVGNPQAQARTVTLATTPTVQSVVALPATVDLPAGASSVNFTITGTLAGAVEIYGVLPANLGAGPSNPAAVTVLNPQPQLSSLTPTTATVGQAGFTLQIAGSNFINGAAAFWNGTALGNPQVTGGTLLTADVLANQLTLSQTVNITVSNPSPSQAVSGSLSFRVISPTLQFSAPAASLGVGQELQLTATLWGNAQSQDRQVDFTQGGGLGLSAASATLLVATPTANLTVTGVTAGSTTVTATVSPLGLISTVNLTVQATTITLSVDSGSQTSLAVGSSAVLRATISHPQPQPRSLTITASTGGVVNIQSPVSLPASANFVTFSITATAAGNTDIQVQLPAEAGGDTDSLPVTTVP
ncbi:MAG: hypothetical protein JNK29_13585, partial [Anaerolineales bacterium]|nr:hypothetical protein [Anaerolineales bacterium]